MLPFIFVTVTFLIWITIAGHRGYYLWWSLVCNRRWRVVKESLSSAYTATEEKGGNGELQFNVEYLKSYNYSVNNLLYSDFCGHLSPRRVRPRTTVARPQLCHQNSGRVVQLGGVSRHLLGRFPGTISEQYSVLVLAPIM